MFDFQSWLDRITRSYIYLDFDSYAASVDFPFVLMTAGATFVLTSPNQLREGFEQFTSTLRALNASDVVSSASALSPVGPELLVGRYETSILRDAVRLFDPVVSIVTLRRSGGIWKAISIANTMTNNRWPIDLPRLKSAGAGGT
ncbi:MAG: hypothetical protein ACKVPY_01660 [Paracoccaceae bacterium]